jgi:hypothetical protein
MPRWLDPYHDTALYTKNSADYDDPNLDETVAQSVHHVQSNVALKYNSLHNFLVA